MKPSSAQLNSIHEPQRVSNILLWLRIVVTALLLGFCYLISIVESWNIDLTVHWKVIAPLVFIQCLLSVAQVSFKNLFNSQAKLCLLIAVDIFLWFGLIYSSGGVINPAISYILILLAVAAISLPQQHSISLTAISSGIYVYLMQTSHHGHHSSSEIAWHLWGMWLLFTLNALILLAVINYLIKIIREKDKSISLHREETVRNEQLIAMGTLAANLAHELGTPLSTVSILLEDEVDETSSMVKEQIERCKRALTELKQINLEGKEISLQGSDVFFNTMYQELLLIKPGQNIEIIDKFKKDVPSSPLLKQSLLALMNNAASACKTKVIVTVFEESHELIIDLQHDGEKIETDLLDKLGTSLIESQNNGLGIGMYLANASIEQLGGSLALYNNDTGVLTRLTLPL